MGLLDADINLLSTEEMDRIHAAALSVLADTGVRVEHERMLELLAADGAEVDPTHMVARFPAAVMEKHIEKAVKTAKEEAPPARPANEPRKFSLHCGATAAYIYDMDTDSIRLATKADHERSTIVANTLDSVVSVGGVFYPRDVPPQTDDIHAWEVVLCRSEKPGATPE